jgi:hypothetical protein
MSLGEKIADAIPESVIAYVYERPLVLTIATGALVVITGALFMQATELDVLACQFRRARLGEIQRAASESLGG